MSSISDEPTKADSSTTNDVSPALEGQAHKHPVPPVPLFSSETPTSTSLKPTKSLLQPTATWPSTSTSNVAAHPHPLTLPSTQAHTTPALSLPIPPHLLPLQTKIQSLQTTLATSTTHLANLTAQLHSPADATVAAHIARLHRYNETKDVGLGLLGLIAEQRGVRLADVLEEWGVGERD